MVYDLQSAIEESFYMIAAFDGTGTKIFNNKKFNMYFPNLEKKEDLDPIILSDEVYTKKKKRVVVESPDMDGIIKFEINYSKGLCTYIGVKLNYEDIMELGDYAGLSAVHYKKKARIISIKNKQNIYCSIIADIDGTIKYTSENTGDIMGIDSEIVGKGIDELLGEGSFDKILRRLEYLNIIDDSVVDIDRRMIAISQLSSGYIVLNIYPYSSNVMNKFEEIAFLKYRIKLLESDINSKNKFIKTQKEVFKSMTTVDGLTKLYNRRYLIEKYNEELEKALQHGYKFSVVTFKLADFKKVNQNLGYEKADIMLKTLSILIRKKLVHKRDMAFRIGSSEFVILSSPSTSAIARETFSDIKNDFEEQTGLSLNMMIMDSDDINFDATRESFLWNGKVIK